MGRRFSKKNGGMPSFGNRGDASRGQRVPRLLPRSPQNMSLDPRVPEFVLPPPPLPPLEEREVIVDIGRDEPPQPQQRSLDPSVSDFVMPPPPPAQVTTTTTYQMGAPVLDPGASEYVAPSQIQLPPPSIRGNVYYPPRTSDLYPNMEFSNSATNIPGLPPKDPSRRWWNIPNREGGKQIKKKSSRTQTRQKKQQQQRRHRSRRNSTRKYKK
jgi:hypothetical protein